MTSVKDLDDHLQKFETSTYSHKFSLFEPLTSDLSINTQNVTKYYPLTKPSPGQCIEFVIPPSRYSIFRLILNDGR